MSTNEETANKLALLVFKQTGLHDLRRKIVDYIEDDIAGTYSAIDDEEDDASTPSYGGYCNSVIPIFTDKDFDYPFDKFLTDKHKSNFLSWTDESTLDLSADRDDFFKQEWSINFLLPVAPSDPNSEVFDFKLTAIVSILGDNHYEVKGSTYNDISNDELDKILFTYSLMS